MYRPLVLTAVLVLLGGVASHAADLEPILEVEPQPLKAQTRRVVQALEFLGQPLTPGQQTEFKDALAETDEQKAVAKIQRALDKLVLAAVDINAESRVKVGRGPADARLTQHGWSVFLVKVDNRAGITAKLAVSSPNAQPLHQRSRGSAEPNAAISPADVETRWLDVAMFDSQPLTPRLSGLRVEYRLLQI